MAIGAWDREVKFMSSVLYQFFGMWGVVVAHSEWPINRLIHRSFTQFNFKILDVTNPVKWGESGTRHGPRRNHEFLMYYIQRRAFRLSVYSRFGKTAQLSRPLLCGDSPKKKGDLAERVKLAFVVIALKKIQKQPIISLDFSRLNSPTTLESSPEGPD